MVSTDDLRAAAHKMVDEADENKLIELLSSDAPHQRTYTAAELTALHEDAEAYERGEGITYSEEEFWQRIAKKTGYQRPQDEA